MARLGRSYPVQRVFKRPTFLPYSGTGVSFLSVGAGASATSSPVNLTTTIPSTTTCTLVWVSSSNSTASPTISAQVGASAATLAAPSTLVAVPGNRIFLDCFYVLSPPIGSQTVSFTTTGTGFTIINVVNYANVSSIGSPVVLGQQTGQPSMSSLTLPGYMYANAFTYAATAGAQTFSVYSQTQRFLMADVVSTSEPILIGDAAGTGGTLTFSATRSNTTNGWGGMIIPLVPI